MHDRVRWFLARHLLSPIGGLAFGDWWRLLRENRFSVDLPYWPRAAFLTIISLYTSIQARTEARRFGPTVEGVPIKPPLFILGHYRSGTTHLHNLLSLDPRFAYPNLFQCYNPHTFLVLEPTLAPKAGRWMIRHRPQDNMAIAPDVPTEEEMALGTLTLLSPYLSWAFSRRYEAYEPYLTFQGVSEAEIRVWKAAFTLFLKKLTWKYDRPLILKSPPNTARIRLLLELFPDARFVHIHRNPYDVFRSTRHLYDTAVAYYLFQRFEPRDLDVDILHTYNVMYGAFFEQRGLIPPGRFVEVRYEDLERDPAGQLRAIYEALTLPDFDSVRPVLATYLASIAGYRKNEHRDLPEPLRERIAREWKRSFEKWGYAIDGKDETHVRTA